MLVLTRRVNESIVIGNDIVVTVLEIQRDSIRLGIKAPHNVDINREEIHLLLADKLNNPYDVAKEDIRSLETANDGI